MKSFFDNLFSAGIKGALTFLFGLVRDDVMAFYRRIILLTRAVFTTGVLTGVCLLLLLSGFLMIHWALFILLPWAESTKGLVLLGLGLFYFIVPLGFLSILLSKHRWLALFKAEDPE